MTHFLHRLMLLALCCILLPVKPVAAHKVNIFALVENGTIIGTATFSGGRPAKQAEIIVLDKDSGTPLSEGKTDEQGTFSLPVPPKAMELKSDLVIVVKAGDGHRNEWLIAAEEYLSATPNSDVAAPARPEPPSAEPAEPEQTTPFSEERLQNLVETAVERQITPLKRLLLENRDRQPAWRDVVAGIGYILGIFSIIAWIKQRKGGSK